MGTMTREALYDLVWSKQIPEVAEGFGVTTKQLVAICKRHQIPVPGRFFWDEVSSGRTATKTPLRRMYAPELEEVALDPGVSQGHYFAFAMGRIEAEGEPLATGVVEKSSAAAEHGGGKRQHKSAKPDRSKRKPVVPAMEERPSFRDIAKKMLNSPMASRQSVWVHDLGKDRAISFMTGLLKQLSKVSIRASTTSDNALFADAYAEVPFVIKSPRRRVMEIRDWGKRYELKYDDRLMFSIWGARAKGIRSEWKDEPDTKIETAIPEIVVNCQLILASQRAYDDEVNENQRQRLHLEHRHALAEQRNAREDERKAFIHRITQIQMEIVDVHNVLALEHLASHTTPDFRRMIGWAHLHLGRLEQDATLERLQQSLVAKGLFPDPDPLFDPEGDPS